MIRYRKLGYVALNVSDVERARTWYESMIGLKFNGFGDSGECFFRASSDHHNLILHRGDKPGLKRIGWELESEAQLDIVSRQLDRKHVAWRSLDRSECRALCVKRCVRMAEPVTGAMLDFYAGMAQMDSPHSPTVAKIQHLSHVVLGTPRYREAVEFYENVLNFRTSDEIDGRINLMRCFPNPYHHSFGIAYSERNSLHHLNFMVSDSDDLECAKSRFEHNNVPMVWGGLHPPSGNVFLFFLDPDGLSLEYVYGMELFPEVGARAARVFQAQPESFDSTGARRDARMAAHGAIETVVAD